VCCGGGGVGGGGAESLAVERWPIISRILWNLVLYCLHRSLSLAALVGQMNPSYTLKISGVAKMHLEAFPCQPFKAACNIENLVLLALMCRSHWSRPSHSSRFNHPTYIHIQFYKIV